MPASLSIPSSLLLWTLTSVLAGYSLSLYFIRKRSRLKRMIIPHAHYLSVFTDKQYSGLPYPPGPKGKPIIGNLLDLPFEKQWETATEFSKEHGGSQMLVWTRHQVFLTTTLQATSSISTLPASILSS
jgi:hypothetical protein